MKWSAAWIWAEGLQDTPNTYVEFRTVLEAGAAEAGRTCRLHVTACQAYELYVNDRFIGRGPSPCSPDYQYYDTYAGQVRLEEGENVIAVVAYHFGEKDIVTGQMQGEAGFLLQAEFDNGEVIAATDASWRCRKSPRYLTSNERISRWSGFKEIYTALGDDGFRGQGYDDSGWERAIVRAAALDPASPWPRLLPREIPFLGIERREATGVIRREDNFGRVTGEFPAASNPVFLDASAPGAMPAIVYDFGSETVGYPVLELDAAQGGVLRIAYGESLELQEVDTFVLRPGKQRLRTFGRRAFRFMKLMLAASPQPAELLSLHVDQVGYPFREEAAFSTDDELLQNIWQVSLTTTRMNSQDHTEDCPWREKSLWVVDGVVMGKIIYANYADTALMRKCLVQGARIQKPDGSIPGTGPETNGMLLPDFCAYWLLGVYDYWQYSGDRTILEELAPAIDRLMNWFRAQSEEDETGLFARADRSGWWCFIDWSDDIDRRDHVSGISFVYYKALQLYARIQAELGAGDAAVQETLARAEKLRADIRRWLWHSERGMYIDCLVGTERSKHFSLQTNFLAIWSGLMSGEERDRFLDDVYAAGALPPVRGPFFQHIVLEVLEQAGRAEQAIALIRGYWGEMLARGATTWWETFDATLPFVTIPSTYQGHTPTYMVEGIPNSLCHAWGASPGYMLHRLLLGVDVSAAGRGVIRLSAPAPEADWAEAEIPLAGGGSIKLAWRRVEDGSLAGEAAIPEGYTVEIKDENRYPLKIVSVTKAEYSA
ncbi:MGH1-like glycoside hydrolase domain-containing protein [Paenibacillus sacheonensis]|uniref:Alpha-L-rhamnosidase n=1 Tax=Paenibacillus sacheonensis TaxID=742054 RepID=A0A7X4YUU0_9BACL|nr:trehalase family glycosidase [Paenibacillus sacheonensis]MBM7567735.1 hypothetical protein [Paenibacillus sacheonensis]NBC71991.1 alpha-L-rhamnosidase [Paenibacillus sacheonensis]